MKEYHSQLTCRIPDILNVFWNFNRVRIKNDTIVTWIWGLHLAIWDLHFSSNNKVFINIQFLFQFISFSLLNWYSQLTSIAPLKSEFYRLWAVQLECTLGSLPSIVLISILERIFIKVTWISCNPKEMLFLALRNQIFFIFNPSPSLFWRLQQSNHSSLDYQQYQPLPLHHHEASYLIPTFVFHFWHQGSCHL